MLMSFVRWMAGQDAPVRQQVSNRDPLPTSPLGRPVPGGALTITGTSASARAQLGAGVSRVSIFNTGDAGANYRLGDSVVVATAADDYIGPGERLDLSVRPGEHLACLGGVLRVTQLAD